VWDTAGASFTVSSRIAAQSEDDYVREGHSALARELQEWLGETPGYGGVLRTFMMVAPYAVHRSARSLLAQRTQTFREAFENLAVPRTYLVGERSLPDFPEGPPLRRAAPSTSYQTPVIS
jgi:hypothetical protein